MADQPQPPVEARTHNLKCWPEVFEEVLAGRKTAEFRLNDRDYQVGDGLLIREWDNGRKVYTHREISRTITHVLKDSFGLPDGYAMLSLSTPAPTGDRRAKCTRLTMPNGEIIECEYPKSEGWADSWSIRYPDTGQIGTTGEQDDEIVERYGLTAILNATILAILALPAEPASTGAGIGGGEMSPEEMRLEDLKQMAAYAGPIVSFDVSEPFYLASCDHCGWVGSTELCGTDTWGDDSDVYCPRCHSSGADCGSVAGRIHTPKAEQPRAEAGLVETTGRILALISRTLDYANPTIDSPEAHLSVCQTTLNEVRELVRALALTQERPL